jgi:hypothetical protein
MKVAYFVILATVALGTAAHAECIGEAEYRVCTDSQTHPNGDLSVRSHDTLGNSYSLDTKSRDLPGGGQEIRSEDSEGNSYSLRSWEDAEGFHSVDSQGNRCTITRTGAMIGCGQ